MPRRVCSTMCRCTESATPAASAAVTPSANVTPDHGSARCNPYRAPMPSYAATSERNASVSRWPEPVRS